MTLRFSSELADDEGRVFLAYAPPRSLLVMGRRDPRNGELCVSRFYWMSPGALWPDPNDPSAPRCEHITGPEAERLLDAVERWMADRVAKWEAEGDPRAAALKALIEKNRGQ